jgi:PKHD-type hydroxylase
MINSIAIRPSEKPAFPSHIQWTGANRLLSRAECEWTIACAERLPLAFASVGTPTVQRTEMETRCVESTGLDTPECDWLYERIASKVQLANQHHYEFDLTGLIEPVQFLKYTTAAGEKPDGHYTWHVDFGEGAMATRKLSMVIQLSPPEAYDGCDFSMMSDRGLQRLDYREQGAAFMVPSWTPHMVGPITRGVRYALVAWVHGPRLR